jgi:transposase-like protein
MAALLEPILNQMLQAEMTEHLGAESDQRIDTRQDYRNGSYATGHMSGSSPRGSERSGWRSPETETGRFKPGSSSDINDPRRPASLFLVLALMQMVVQGVSTRRVKKITTKLCGRKFSTSTVSRLTTELDEQVAAWAKRPLEKSYPFLVLDAMHVKVRRQGAVRSTTSKQQPAAVAV